MSEQMLCRDCPVVNDVACCEASLGAVPGEACPVVQLVAARAELERIKARLGDDGRLAELIGKHATRWMEFGYKESKTPGQFIAPAVRAYLLEADLNADSPKPQIIGETTTEIQLVRDTSKDGEPTGETYEITTLMDIYEKIPPERLPVFMRELELVLAHMRATSELFTACAEQVEPRLKEVLGGRQLLTPRNGLSPLVWLDDGKGEISAKIVIPDRTAKDDATPSQEVDRNDGRR